MPRALSVIAHRMLRASCIALLAALVSPWLHAQGLGPIAGPKKVEAVEVELISLHASAQPGAATRVGLRIRHDPHWHTYWRNPGDSGLPTTLTWTLPPGWSAGPIQWPVPQRLPVGPLTNFGYEDQIVLPVDVTVPPEQPTDQPAVIQVQADWLMCKDVCIPGQASLKLELAVSRAEPVQARWASLFESMRVPQTKDWSVRLGLDGQAARLEWRSASAGLPRQVMFFPYKEGWLANAAQQTLHAAADAYALRLPLAGEAAPRLQQLSGLGQGPLGLLVIDGDAAEVKATWVDPVSGALGPVLSSVGGVPSSSSPEPIPDAASAGLLAALAAAFLGGLILNLMPCVFPVLGLKVLAFAGAEGSLAQSRSKALWFLAGVLVSFWALAALMLALQSAGTAVGWGFQLQSPWFIAAMALLFTTLAVNLLGVFEWGVSATRLGGIEARLQGQGHARSAAAASGALAVIVATPCTAPFMGSALGFTLGQAPDVVLAVFTALALGLAAPFVILGWFPQALRRLPRPGAWMQTLRSAFAFPMLATVVWLLWVLAQQTSLDTMALVAMLCLAWAFALWLWQSSTVWWSRAIALTVFASALIASAAHLQQGDHTAQVSVASPTKDADAWQEWSPARVQQAQAAGQTVFIDFTAAWCVSCQVNKRVVLDSNAVTHAFAQNKVVLLRADWTRRDAQITQALAQYGRTGVPLYLVFRAGQSKPTVLPEILTQRVVLEAIGAAHWPLARSSAK